MFTVFFLIEYLCFTLKADLFVSYYPGPGVVSFLCYQLLLPMVLSNNYIEFKEKNTPRLTPNVFPLFFCFPFSVNDFFSYLFGAGKFGPLVKSDLLPYPNAAILRDN